MQSRQPQTSDDRISLSPPLESANIRTARLAESSRYEATVAPALKAETGFSDFHSYRAYLANRNCFKEPEGLRNYSMKAVPQCAIIDLSMEKLLPAKVSLRGVALSATQTFTALREPPSGVSVQVVVLSIPETYGLGLASKFASVLGLGLKLTPRFFDAVHAQLEMHAKPEVTRNARFRCKYLLVSGAVVAIARHSALAKPDSPPIVLIAGPRRIHAFVDTSAFYDNLYEGRPFPDWALQDLSSGRGDLDNDDLDSEGARHSAQLLCALMEQNQDCAHSCNDVLLGSLLPLLQLDIFRLRDLCLRVRAYFAKVKSPVYVKNDFEITEDHAPSPKTDEAPDNLYRWRAELRSIVDQFEDEAEPLTEFVRSQIGEEMTRSSVYFRIQRERDSVLKEARRLEAEIRDYLQVQAGQLSLLESRKSIELSSYQISEGRRGQPLPIY